MDLMERFAEELDLRDETLDERNERTIQESAIARQDALVAAAQARNLRDMATRHRDPKPDLTVQLDAPEPTYHAIVLPFLLVAVVVAVASLLVSMFGSVVLSLIAGR